MKKFLKNNWYYILIFLIFLGLCFLFPYTGDDWQWGSRIGLERLDTWFKDYNGRYAGNLLVLLITRSVIIRSLIESICFTLIVYLINRIINKDNKMISVLMIFMLCLLPVEILRQTVVWASGFSNYVPPILFVLIFIDFNKYLFDDKVKKHKTNIFNVLLLLIFGFVGALFIENITIYACILGLFVCVYEFIRIKKISLYNISYFVGSVCGASVMFSNNAYHMVSTGTDTYRKVEQGNVIVKCIRNYLLELNKHIFYNNFILGVLLSILIFYFLYKIIKTNKNKLVIYGAYICALFTGLYFTNNIFRCLNTYVINIKLYNNLLNAGLTMLLSISLIFVFIYGVKTSNVKRKLFFYLGTIVITNLPLLLVSPIGPRLFLSNYIFFTMIILELFNTFDIKEKVLYNFIKIGTICFLGFFMVIFLQIHRVQTEMEKHIEANRDKKFINVPALPFTYYLHGANPNNDKTYNYRFKVFYGLDEKVVVKFEKYGDWKKNQKAASN